MAEEKVIKALTWDQDGKRFYEVGVEEAVLFVKGTKGYMEGEAWNGLTGITESPSGAEPTALYANNKKYLNLLSSEEFGGTIEAYTYPDGFAKCNGEGELVSGVTIGQQTRASFGLVYKTLVGNDVTSAVAGSANYKLHIVYNCLVSPSERAYSTINESPEAGTLSWEFTTTKVNVDGFSPTAIVTIDATKLDATGKGYLVELEKLVYGTKSDDTAGATVTQKPYLPSIADIAKIFNGKASEVTNTEPATE